MRFTTTHLLLIFPAFIIAMQLVISFEHISHSYPQYTFHDAMAKCRQLQYSLEYAIDYEPEVQITDETINRWLAGQLPPDDSSNLSWAVNSPEPDPWNNPYRLARNIKLADGSTAEVGIYSTGDDGISRTEGNDPDDLNSWDPECDTWYHDQVSIIERWNAIVPGIFVTPFVYAFLLGSLRLGQWCCRFCSLKSQPRSGESM